MPAEKETHLKEVLVKVMAMQMFSFGVSFEIEKKILLSSVCLLLLIPLFAFPGYQRQGSRYAIQINVNIKLCLMQP